MRKLLSFFIAIIIVVSSAGIADDVYYGWVICHPESHVNIREKPKKSGAEGGQLYCGDRVETDGIEKNGYLHIIDTGTEAGEGWVHTGYIVYDEPDEVNELMIITSPGRVACRRWIGGKLRRWAKPGSSVMVYWISYDWAVTSKGYIMSKYLREE